MTKAETINRYDEAMQDSSYMDIWIRAKHWGTITNMVENLLEVEKTKSGDIMTEIVIGETNQLIFD